MITIHLDDFLENGILKESAFREKIAVVDWTQYQGEKVMIKGCTDVPVPTWAYMIVTAYLAQHAKSILYGEPCAAIKIYKNES